MVIGIAATGAGGIVVNVAIGTSVCIVGIAVTGKNQTIVRTREGERGTVAILTLFYFVSLFQWERGEGEILSGDARNLPRKILEQVALDGFKSGQFTTSQVRRILGFDSRMQVHEFLAAHGVPWVDYDEEELQRECESLGRFSLEGEEAIARD
jgi:predicted HTH domain antitoxin